MRAAPPCLGVCASKVCVLLALAMGAAVTCASQPSLSHNQLVGIFLALGSTAIGALGVVLSGVLLADYKLQPLALLLYLSPLQAALVSGSLPFTELGSFVRWSAANDPVLALGRLLGGASLNFCMQVPQGHRRRATTPDARRHRPALRRKQTPRAA